MNKHLSIAVLVFILATIALVISLIVPGHNIDTTPLSDSEFQTSTFYSCAEGRNLYAEFGDRLVRVTLSDSRVYTLEEVTSASGARYANDGDQVVFITEDRSAHIEEEGVTTHRDCIPLTIGAEVTRSGTVVEVDKEQATYDGPILITIESATGMFSTIAVPSMGLPTCTAYQNGNMIDPFTIEVGSPLEVAGTISDDGTIVPCQKETHYLR
jgi:membrane-bound inhibitor of C-type lysozyme